MEDILSERKKFALKHIYEVDYEVEQVECNDYGDETYQYHVMWYITTADGIDHAVYDDYWIDEPNDTQIYNCLLSAINDGFSVIERIEDIIKQGE